MHLERLAVAHAFEEEFLAVQVDNSFSAWLTCYSLVNVVVIRLISQNNILLNAEILIVTDLSVDMASLKLVPDPERLRNNAGLVVRNKVVVFVDCHAVTALCASEMVACAFVRELCTAFGTPVKVFLKLVSNGLVALVLDSCSLVPLKVIVIYGGIDASVHLVQIGFLQLIRCEQLSDGNDDLSGAVGDVPLRV